MVNGLRLLRPAFLLVVLAGCPDDLGEGLDQGSPTASPSHLQAVANDGFEVALSWSDNAVGETGYRLEMGSAPIGAAGPDEFRILAPNTRSMVYETFPNRTYYFRVVAVTDTMESGPSNEASVTTPKELRAPGSISASSESPTQVQVSWEDVRGETGYLVQCSTDQGTTWSAGASAGADTSGTTVPGLSPDSLYLVRVLTVYSYGLSDPTPPVEVLTLTASVVRREITNDTDNIGEGISLVQRASGLVQVVSYARNYHAMVHTTELGYRVGDGYTSGLVDTYPPNPEDIGRDGVSFVLDGANGSHVVGHDVTNDRLCYFTSPAGPWVREVIDPGPGGAKPRLVRNPVNGALHVLYQSASTKLKHRIKSGAVWSFSETLEPTIDSGAMHAFAFDSGGVVHLAVARSSGSVFYGNWNPVSGTWAYQDIVPETHSIKAGWVSIAVDSTGTVHCVIYDKAGKSLHHLERKPGIWITELIDRTVGADVGEWCSVAVQPGTNRLHVAYYDSTHGDLRYARKDVGGTWVRRSIDATGDVGRYPSIAVDAAGKISIAYRSETRQCVKLAQGSP